MKKETILYFLIAALVAGLAYVLFFRKKQPPASTVNTLAPIPPVAGTDGTCFEVPSSLAPFSSAVMPTGAQQYLGYSDAQFTENLQYRILGFFAGIDVQPTLERMKYFGKQAILDYLATPSGQLPHWDVVKSSLRCQTKKNFTKQIM